MVISEWLEQRSIKPLVCGMSGDDLVKLSCISRRQIKELKKQKVPYIILDFVDFHFTDDLNYTGLEEIVVNVLSHAIGEKKQCFDPGWLW
jgi:hypothetical protein